MRHGPVVHHVFSPIDDASLQFDFVQFVDVHDAPRTQNVHFDQFTVDQIQADKIQSVFHQFRAN